MCLKQNAADRVRVHGRGKPPGEEGTEYVGLLTRGGRCDYVRTIRYKYFTVSSGIDGRFNLQQ